MALIVKHSKTVTIPDPTQAQLDAQIALGNYPPGTTLAMIALASDHNENLLVTGELGITNGGTGASDAPTARANLGLGSIATHAETDYLATANNLSDVSNADDSVKNIALLMSNNPDGSAVISGSSRWFFYDGDNDQGAYVKGSSLQDAILSTLGALAYNNTIDLASEVTGDLPFSNIAQIATTQFIGRNTAGTGDIESLSMTTAKTMLGYQYGQETNEVTLSQSISGSSTYTQNISLSNSNWTNGVLVVKDSTTGSQSYAIIHFTDTVAQSAGMSGSCNYTSYIGKNTQLGGGVNGIDGRVTAENAFLGASSVYPGTIAINSVRISGSNLEIIWKNNSGSTQTASAKIRYYLMRGDKVTA